MKQPSGIIHYDFNGRYFCNQRIKSLHPESLTKDKNKLTCISCQNKVYKEENFGMPKPRDIILRISKEKYKELVRDETD